MRKHQVEDDEVVLGRASLEISLFAIIGDVNRKTFLFEALAERTNKRFMIFNKKQTHDYFQNIMLKESERRDAKGYQLSHATPPLA